MLATATVARVLATATRLSLHVAIDASDDDDDESDGAMTSTSTSATVSVRGTDGSRALDSEGASVALTLSSSASSSSSSSSSSDSSASTSDRISSDANNDEDGDDDDVDQDDNDDDGKGEAAPRGRRLSSVAAPSAPPSEFAPLKHYLKPICTIGKGSFGSVQLVKHSISERFYALKTMHIPTILEKGQRTHVFNEKRILARLDHPFIVKLYDTAKDKSHLYMILEFLPGGDLFSYLRVTTLPSYAAKFYAAQIICALEYLHTMFIAYRDLKAENCLITADGHLKLADLGFAKEIHSKSYTMCGTITHLAPESLARKGHTISVDYYALGVVIFEMIAGRVPFTCGDTREMLAEIEAAAGDIPFPRKTFSANAKSLVSGLMQPEPAKRLGAGTIEEIKQHAWFSETCFERILLGTVNPPLRPTVYGDGDVGNFDSYADLHLEAHAPAKQRELDLFDEW